MVARRKPRAKNSRRDDLALVHADAAELVKNFVTRRVAPKPTLPRIGFLERDKP
jgi:hypothetical protein